MGAEELTSSQIASSEEAEQSDASMMQRETNKQLQTLKDAPVTSSASLDHLHSDSCHRAKMLDRSKPKGVTRLRLHKSTETLVTHSEGEVRGQRRRVEIIKDGVLEVWKLQTCGDTKHQQGNSSRDYCHSYLLNNRCQRSSAFTYSRDVCMQQGNDLK